MLFIVQLLPSPSFSLKISYLKYDMICFLVIYQVYTAKSVKSDKFKTGREEFVEEEVVYQDNRDIIIGRIPVMVRSDLCWMNEVEKADCDFDHGGYFLIKGTEKVNVTFLICSTRNFFSVS